MHSLFPYIHVSKEQPKRNQIQDQELNVLSRLWTDSINFKTENQSKIVARTEPNRRSNPKPQAYLAIALKYDTQITALSLTFTPKDNEITVAHILCVVYLARR